jgi:hypothetical protein
VPTPSGRAQRLGQLSGRHRREGLSPHCDPEPLGSLKLSPHVVRATGVLLTASDVGGLYLGRRGPAVLSYMGCQRAVGAVASLLAWARPGRWLHDGLWRPAERAVVIRTVETQVHEEQLTNAVDGASSAPMSCSMKLLQLPSLASRIRRSYPA